MDQMTDQQFDKVDAIFFSGDSLLSDGAIDVAEKYLTRWVGQLKVIRETLKDMEEGDE